MAGVPVLLGKSGRVNYSRSLFSPVYRSMILLEGGFGSFHRLRETPELDSRFAKNGGKSCLECSKEPVLIIFDFYDSVLLTSGEYWAGECSLDFRMQGLFTVELLLVLVTGSIEWGICNEFLSI